MNTIKGTIESLAPKSNFQNVFCGVFVAKIQFFSLENHVLNFKPYFKVSLTLIWAVFRVNV